MPWVENNKKKSKSSMTYDELIRIVDAYDILKEKVTNA